MIPIIFLTTLVWIAALFYYRLGCPAKRVYENTWGFKAVFWTFSVFALGLLAFRFLNDKSPVIQYVAIAAFGFLIWSVAVREIVSVLSRFWSHSVYWESLGLAVVGFAITELIVNQVFLRNLMVSNSFAFFIVVISLEFAVRLTKPAFISLLALTMLGDIYFVWMAASAPASDIGQTWYMEMFHSDFVNHLPFPIGFRWGDQFLGSGDVFFLTMTVMYARRVWSLKAAVVAGTMMTLPIFLLPLAAQLVSEPPLMWPYTIFIAPVAIILAALRKDDRISASA